VTKELAAATHDSVAHFAEVIFVNAFENQSRKLAINLGRVNFEIEACWLLRLKGNKLKGV